MTSEKGNGWSYLEGQDKNIAKQLGGAWIEQTQTGYKARFGSKITVGYLKDPVVGEGNTPRLALKELFQSAKRRVLNIEDGGQKVSYRIEDGTLMKINM